MAGSVPWGGLQRPEESPCLEGLRIVLHRGQNFRGELSPVRSVTGSSSWGCSWKCKELRHTTHSDNSGIYHFLGTSLPPGLAGMGPRIRSGTSSWPQPCWEGTHEPGSWAAAALTWRGAGAGQAALEAAPAPKEGGQVSGDAGSSCVRGGFLSGGEAAGRVKNSVVLRSTHIPPSAV